MKNHFRMGVFILVAVAIGSAGIFLIGRQELKFVSTYEVRSEFENVAGLTEGAEVRVGGIHRGTVRSIHLPGRPDGKVTVLMVLAADTRAIVKKDSVASIQSAGLLGDKFVELSFGSVDAERLKDGETLDSQAPLDVSELFQKANQILDSTQGELESVQGVTENLNQITAKINTGHGTVGKLINDGTLYQQAAAGVTSLQEDADALKHNFLLRGFFQNRGYANADEIKKHQIARMPDETPVKSFELDSKGLFDKAGSAKLKNTKMLDTAGKYLQAHAFGSALVAASWGMYGDTEKDFVLTEARSFVVRKYLVDHYKFDDTRLKTIGLGKSADASPDGSVEILVYADPVADSSTPAKGPRK
jgi:phospholipid/cholesterol/gamma-HCH transport system substrate-binding protein